LYTFDGQALCLQDEPDYCLKHTSKNELKFTNAGADNLFYNPDDNTLNFANGGCVVMTSGKKKSEIKFSESADCNLSFDMNKKRQFVFSKGQCLTGRKWI